MPDNGTSSNGCTTGNKNYSDGRRLPIETNQADMKAHPKCKRMKFIKKKLYQKFYSSAYEDWHGKHQSSSLFVLAYTSAKQRKI